MRVSESTRIAMSILSLTNGARKLQLYTSWPTISQFLAMGREAVVVLDLLVEFFDGGRRWSRGCWKSPYGRRNLPGALHHVRESRGSKDSVEHFLQEAIDKKTRKPTTIVRFNRTRRHYREVHAVLILAREMAQRFVDHHPLNPSNATG